MTHIWFVTSYVYCTRTGMEAKYLAGRVGQKFSFLMNRVVKIDLLVNRSTYWPRTPICWPTLYNWRVGYHRAAAHTPAFDCIVQSDHSLRLIFFRPTLFPLIILLEFRVMLWLRCGPCALVNSQGLSLPSSLPSLPYLSSNPPISNSSTSFFFDSPPSISLPSTSTSLLFILFPLNYPTLLYLARIGPLVGQLGNRGWE